MKINAEKAINISLQFSKFFLPTNSILKIYNQFELTDSITSKENNEHNIWATRVYQGNKLTIEMVIEGESAEAPSLVIDKVNFGYKKFGTEFFGQPGASAPCNINIVCPEGAGWENERNSVALIVANGSEACTGSLIMNTCNTSVPYFLTANHCLAAGNVPNWVFQFQTWSATCSPNGAYRQDVQFNGCSLKASSAASDFALLQLNNIPDANSGINYSGWNRNGNLPIGAVNIHHPAGDLMKFSRDFDPLGTSSWGGANNHWVTVFEQGTVQPGSSGSALYDMNHRIIGQLHGDQQNQGNYCTQRRGEYGKFDKSWIGGGTNTTRLSNWLDPNNTGATTINTTNVSQLPITITPVGNVIGYFTTNPQPQSGGSGSTQTPLANDTYQSFYVPRSSYVSMNFVVTSPTFPLYQWSTSSGNSSATGLSYGSSVQASAYGYSSVVKTIYLDAGSLCGTKRIGYTFNVVSLGWSFRIAASPNPTKDNLNIAIDVVDDKTGEVLTGKNYQKSSLKTSSTVFSLYEINSNQLVKQWKFEETDNMNYNIKFKGLKTGVYVLKMERDGQSATSKILFQ